MHIREESEKKRKEGAAEVAQKWINELQNRHEWIRRPRPIRENMAAMAR